MRINLAVPEEHVSPGVLNPALEAVTKLDEAQIAAGHPTFEEALGHVRWKPEPPGQEHFDHGREVLSRGWGDCDDLAPWHAASLRVTGEDPGARAIVKRSGPKKWHAVVERSDGSIDDPSRAAGMGRPHGIHGAVLPPMVKEHAVSGVNGEVGSYFYDRPQLALRPLRDRAGQLESWQARADLPWHWLPGDSPHDAAMVSLHRSPVTSQTLVGARSAVLGATRGAALLGELNGADPEHIDRLDAIADACEGMSHEDLCREYGIDCAVAAETIVSGFFGDIGNWVSHAVRDVGHWVSHAVSDIGNFVVHKIGHFIVKDVLPIAYNAVAAAVNAVPGIGTAISVGMLAAEKPLLDAVNHEVDKLHLPRAKAAAAKAHAFKQAKKQLRKRLLKMHVHRVARMPHHPHHREAVRILRRHAAHHANLERGLSNLDHAVMRNAAELRDIRRIIPPGAAAVVGQRWPAYA